MTSIRHCDNCGATIDIEDNDDLVPLTDELVSDEEHVSALVLCSDCRHHQDVI